MIYTEQTRHSKDLK